MHRTLRRMATVLILSMLVALAAVTVPSLGGGTGADPESRARSDVHAIAAALARFMADTGHAPTGFLGAETYSYLRTQGETPEFSSDPGGWIGSLDWFLKKNYMADRRWRGPYDAVDQPDPWGHRYVVWVGALAPDARRLDRTAWVLSAGANGVVETTPDSREPCGDDIGCPVLD